MQGICDTADAHALLELALCVQLLQKISPKP
jgi:hypothetical protein